MTEYDGECDAGVMETGIKFTCLDIEHPERRLLIIAEAQLAPEDVENVLMFDHRVALQTSRPRAPADDLLPGVDICNRLDLYGDIEERLAASLLIY